MAEINNEYIHYQNMVSTINTALSDMARLCDQMKMTERREELEEYQKKLASHTFSVGIMGEFKRGKSTVINSLLEKEIMPADIGPWSATMNRVTYDLHPHVQLNMRDGSTREIPVEELASYVTKLTVENESRAAQVDEAVVYYPCRFCMNGVDIVDTPGLNDDERMNKISEEVIPQLDAVIMVLTPDNPFSMSEAEFVRNKLMASDLSRLIFVVNKIDTIRRAADRKRVVDSIREKIQKSVLEKMANVYGEGSPEYEEAVKKMGNIRIFPLSALDALDGKMERDEELIEKSGTREFEAALTRMLTEERGALELSTAVSVIARAAVEITKMVDLRKSALELNAKEFAEGQQQALQELTNIREDKKQEKTRLRESARSIKMEMRQRIGEFYPELENRLNEALDAAVAEVDMVQLKTDAGLKAVAEQLQSVISKVCQDEISLFSEKLLDRLDQQIGRDVRENGMIVSNITDKLDKLNETLVLGKSGVERADLVAGGIDALAMTTGVFGVGGVISGYRAAGYKGALLGGGVGAVTSFISLALLLQVATVGMPLLVIAGIAGSVSGKFATKFLFGKEMGQKKLAEIRSSIAGNIGTIVGEIRSYHELEDWCEKVINSRYEHLIGNFEQEMERLLKSTEANIDEIKHDITQNDIQRKQLTEKFDNILERVCQITQKDIAPISQRVRSVLDDM